MLFVVIDAMSTGMGPVLLSVFHAVIAVKAIALKVCPGIDTQQAHGIQNVVFQAFYLLEHKINV